MSYAVVRVQKMTAGSVKGIEIHDRREKEISHTNPDIDHARSDQNYDLCPAQNQDFCKAVKERIDQLDLKKAVRKDAVVMAQVLVTSDAQFFVDLKEQTKAQMTEAYAAAAYTTYNSDVPFMESEISQVVESTPDHTYEFFQQAYNFLADRYGHDNVISATVHMDEMGAPHMHFNFVPVTPDGRLCAKEVLTRKSLTEQQTAFHEQVGQKYGLLRGEPKSSGKRRKHMETAEYKAYMDTMQKAAEKASEAERHLKELQDEVRDLEDKKIALTGDLKVMEGIKADLESAIIDAAEAKSALKALKEREPIALEQMYDDRRYPDRNDRVKKVYGDVRYLVDGEWIGLRKMLSAYKQRCDECGREMRNDMASEYHRLVGSREQLR